LSNPWWANWNQWIFKCKYYKNFYEKNYIIVSNILLNQTSIQISLQHLIILCHMDNSCIVLLCLLFSTFLLIWFLTNRSYGDIIEALYMQEVAPPEQPLYARVVIRSRAVHMVDYLLESTNKVKLSINGKHAWARKYLRKGNKSPRERSPLTSRAPSPTSASHFCWTSICWNVFRCFNYEKMLRFCC